MSSGWIKLEPTWVRAYGPNSAIVLAVLDSWLPYATKSYNGHAWVYKTNKAWADETGLTVDQARDAKDKLRRLGIIEAISNPHHAFDRTLWFRIDRAKHEAVLAKSAGPVTTDAGSGPNGKTDKPESPVSTDMGVSPNAFGSEATSCGPEPEAIPENTYREHIPETTGPEGVCKFKGAREDSTEPEELETVEVAEVETSAPAKRSKTEKMNKQLDPNDYNDVLQVVRELRAKFPNLTDDEPSQARQARQEIRRRNGTLLVKPQEEVGSEDWEEWWTEFERKRQVILNGSSTPSLL